jgi:RNA polymerase sigma-70 factor (ECF subfamily)
MDQDTTLARDLWALRPKMLGYALRLCRQHAAAEDLLQDTFESAWRRRETFTPGTNLSAWFGTILYHRWTDLYRRRRRVQLSQLSDPTQFEDDKTNEAISMALPGGQFERVYVAELLAKLPAHAVSIVGLTAMGYSVEECAALLRTSPGTVKSRTNRARARLKNLDAKQSA